MLKVTGLVLLSLFIGSCKCDWWTDYLKDLIDRSKGPSWAPDYLVKQQRKDTVTDSKIEGIQNALDEVFEILEEQTKTGGAGGSSGGVTPDQINVIRNQIQDLKEFKEQQERKNENIEQLIRQIQKALDELFLKVDQGQGATGSGNTYTRWGKASCPSDTTLVYDGYAAGSAKYIKGSGANFLCLPKNPEWEGHSDAKQAWIGRLFGVEYQIKDNTAYSTSFHNKEMACSVCLTTKRSTSLMVPGKVTCPNGWNKEYSGYLMSQASGSDRQPSEYICVDKNLDAVPVGNVVDNDQAVVYLVEGVCGSLQCPPYVDGRELTCVVCSK